MTLPTVAGDALAPMIVPARTALLVIDVQIDFVAPDGPMGSAGVDMSTIPPALDRIHSIIAAARAAAATVGFVRVVTRPETDSDALKLLMARKGLPPESVALCRDGTPGADYYQVRPLPGELEIQKTLFSSFVGTRLEEQLRERGIDTLVVVGFTTECCVDCTVRDAFHRNFNVFIVADACAAYSPSLHYGALESLALNCALLTESEAVLEAWTPGNSGV
ncbi:MAG: isochorismatase [Gammaproteobacteria bacterium]|nr:isochorismatase [Gammaproteobacteria bacterium]